MTRSDGRLYDQLRPTSIRPDVLMFAEGSATIETGQTQVLCAVSVEDGVPPFLRDSGQGWITSEYSMLPRATLTRTRRERSGLKGRTQEIQRLIGRSLRAAVDLDKLGERTITIDCDVIQADGGTRTASITGAYAALYRALSSLVDDNVLPGLPLKHAVASTSVGVVDGEVLLDLNYEEDSQAEVDFNVVMTDLGEFVEVQGTAEDGSFSRETLDEILSVASKGIEELFEIQQRVLGLAASGG
jgi:ribonuclease PH